MASILMRFKSTFCHTHGNSISEKMAEELVQGYPGWTNGCCDSISQTEIFKIMTDQPFDSSVLDSGNI